ncbi:MAG TPA: NAD kinase [Tenuifilaceae bacterium]|nr:NAD kinase [Tenuifilaceae bacterium]HOZ14567.1 NAD kinase [Tenuifilaceae bacterium]HPN21141.1 NAD kinase [Tenuifilaceae bacterium]HPV55586.1 NAD kinase [Tenuifilaceae bacterium]
MIIAVYGKHIESEYNIILGDLFAQLKKYNAEIWVYEPLLNYLKNNLSFNINNIKGYNKPEEIKGKADYMVSLGGDGTFLDSVAFVQESNIPIMGVNFGRLGFLANISIPEMNNAIDLLFAGRYNVEKRSMLEVVSETNFFQSFPYGLNDFTIQKSGTAMLNINTYIDNEYLSTYWADGLIISTPTGSTAYSLSVGGPIVNPNLSAFILSAIAPHHLTVRPLVIPDTSTLRLEASGRDGKVLLSLDSRNIICESPITIQIKKAPFSANVICLEGTTFYRTLREKLLWGIDKRN